MASTQEKRLWLEKNYPGCLESKMQTDAFDALFNKVFGCINNELAFSFAAHTMLLCKEELYVDVMFFTASNRNADSSKVFQHFILCIKEKMDKE